VPRPALGAHLLPGFADWAGTTGIYRGANPPEGALLAYWIKEDTGEPVKIAIEGPGQRPVANLTGSSRAGLNRVTWDLIPTKDVLTEYGGEGKLLVAPGEYKVTLTYGKAKSEQRLKVEVPPEWRPARVVLPVEDEAAEPPHRGQGRMAAHETGGAAGPAPRPARARRHPR